MYSNVSKTGSEVPQKVNENMKLYVTVSIKSWPSYHVPTVFVFCQIYLGT